MKPQTAKAKTKRAKLTPEQKQAAKDRVQGLCVFTTQEAAAFLSCSRQYLEGLRVHGGGPKFARVSRLVRYQRDALLAFLNRHTVASTSEKAPK